MCMTRVTAMARARESARRGRWRKRPRRASRNDRSTEVYDVDPATSSRTTSWARRSWYPALAPVSLPVLSRNCTLHIEHHHVPSHVPWKSEGGQQGQPLYSLATITNRDRGASRQRQQLAGVEESVQSDWVTSVELAEWEGGVALVYQWKQTQTALCCKHDSTLCIHHHHPLIRPQRL